MTDWNIQYRPLDLDEYIGQDFIREKMKILSTQIQEGKKDCPHLLFSGDHGSGKTTMVYSFLRHTYGKDWDFNFHEINSSSEGNIETIRTQIKDWCSNSTLGFYTTSEGETKEIPFTFIFLDEVDGMSKQAQFALRRVMEDYRVRFILSCNYIHKVLKPLQDRTMHFHFPLFRVEDLHKILKNIVEKEGINISDDLLLIIAENSHGSARQAQKILQKVTLTREAITKEEVMKNIEGVKDIFDVNILMRLVEANASGDSKMYESVHEDFSDFLASFKERGYSGEDVIKMIYKNMTEQQMDLQTKKYLTKGLAETLYRGHFCNDIYLYIELWARSLGVD